MCLFLYQHQFLRIWLPLLDTITYSNRYHFITLLFFHHLELLNTAFVAFPFQTRNVVMLSCFILFAQRGRHCFIGGFVYWKTVLITWYHSFYPTGSCGASCKHRRQFSVQHDICIDKCFYHRTSLGKQKTA